MARSIRRRWTADDVTKLRQLAGKHPRNAIAAQLGRGPSALAVKAHLLKVSLRVVRNCEAPTFSDADPGPPDSIGPSDQGSNGAAGDAPKDFIASGVAGIGRKEECDR
jgi:hypothetical protein